MKQLFTYYAFFFGFFFAFGTDITCRPKVAIAGLTLPTATKLSHMYREIAVKIPYSISDPRVQEQSAVHLSDSRARLLRARNEQYLRLPRVRFNHRGVGLDIRECNEKAG
jgi:hypothetical protein